VDEAFKLFLEHQGEIALMITDIVMQNMDGIELANKIRAQSSMPIIFMTGYGYEQHLQQGEISMMTIFKPFSVPELSRCIGRLLQA